jgi:hypothetical protein
MPRFYRLSTDEHVIPAAWEDACAGPIPSTCWLIGGGPSLAQLPCADIARSPAPKMAINLSGVRLIRPNFWTAYDPAARFHRSVYLDAGVIKFMPRARAFDVVPESTFKVCDCPQTYFFDRDPCRGYHDLLDPAAPGIVDWADSLVQAVEILYRLGFRRLLLAGCELCLRPSRDWVRRANELGVIYMEGEPLKDFARRCREKGLSDDEMARLGAGPLYHFDETKPFAAALATDSHYFRVVQSLRLSRRSLCQAGLQLISVTPRSRLNPFFEYRPVEAALDQLRIEIGDPQREPTRGLYTQTAERPRPGLGLMRDVLPLRNRKRRSPCGGGNATVETSKIDSAELVIEAETWEPITPPGEFTGHFTDPEESPG